MVVRVSDEELAKLHRVAEAQNRDISRVIRAVINSLYAERFGTEAPPKLNARNTRRKAA